MLYVIQSRISFTSLDSVVVAVRSSQEAARIEARSLVEHAAPNGSVLVEQGSPDYALHFFIKHPDLKTDAIAFVTVWALNPDESLDDNIFDVYRRMNEVFKTLQERRK